MSLVLGTATPGGGFPIYGDAVAATLNEVDPALDVTTRNTKGSTENVPLLEAGALDLALVQGEVAHEALSGVGRPPATLKILAAMYSTPGMFVVRADSPYRRVEDLRGKPVAFGAKQLTTSNLASAGVLAGDFVKVITGPCQGDSGAPNLLTGTNTVLAITSYSNGNPNCNGDIYSERIDTAAAQAFLDSYVQ